MASAVGFIMSSVVRFHYGVCGGLSILNEIPYGKGWVGAHSLAIKRNSLRERMGEVLTSLLLNEIPYGKSCNKKICINLYKSAQSAVK